MKRIFLLPLLVLALLLSGCGNRSKKDFNQLLVALADKDQTIDTNDWKQITNYLDRNKTHFKTFYHDGQIDAKAVEVYVQQFFSKRRPPKTIRFIGIGGGDLTFNIYLEKSASMAAYDSPQGDGSFHATVMALQNNLPGKSNVKQIGQQGYTDFKEIFNNLLNRTGDNQVSILITDLIYSVKDMNGVNPQKVFSEMQGMINSVFKDEVKHKSILVVRFMGSYNGPYYSYDNSVHQFDGRRPYYVIIVGSNDNIARLTSDPQFRTFAELQQMRGYDNQCLFTSDDIYSPYFSFLLDNSAIRGRFQPERGQSGQITSLVNVEPDKDSGDLQLVLAVDLSKMMIDQRYLTDKNNYRVEADDDISIKEIRPITKHDITPAEKEYIGSATHIFVLHATKITHEQDVDIKLINQLPSWIETGSDDNDLQPDNSTTFGLRYLLGGIYDSYKRNAENEPTYFELEMKLDR